MISFTIHPTSKLWLMTFLLLWAGMLFGGLLFGDDYDGHNRHRMPVWTRMISSFMLVLGAWSWWMIADDTPLDSMSFLIAVGMTLGFIGDLFMARLILRDESHILAGMAAFGLGHVAYILAMLIYLRSNNLTFNPLPLLFWLVMAVILWFVIVYRPAEHKTTVHLAALPYGLLLASTTGIASILALENTTFIWMAVGASLFLLSDLLLAARLFNNLEFPMIDDFVWLLYGPAQMLIVYAIPIQSVLG